MLIIFTISMLILLEGARRDSRSGLATEYRFKLFQLRDRLREQATESPEVARGWVFKYLDSTITKFISQLPGLSLWHMLALVITHSNSAEFMTHRKHLEREFAKPKNQKLKQVEVELMATIGSYLAKKHTGARYAFETLRA